VKLLFLARSANTALFRAATALAGQADSERDSVVVVAADEWMPESTGKTVDRDVTMRLRQEAADFDVVHAFGYRCAWACAEAFGDREAWTFSVIDPPRTRHAALMQRLNDAQFGVCASTAIKMELGEWCNATLFPVWPGVEALAEGFDGASVRAAKEMEADAQVVFLIHDERETDQDGALLESMDRAWLRVPAAQFVFTSPLEGQEANDLRRVLTETECLAIADLIVVGPTKQGFSYPLATGMLLSKAALVSRTAAIADMVEERVSGYFYESMYGLGDSIAGLLQSPLSLGVAGNAARVRAEALFDLVSRSRDVYDLFHEHFSG